MISDTLLDELRNAVHDAPKPFREAGYEFIGAVRFGDSEKIRLAFQKCCSNRAYSGQMNLEEAWYTVQKVYNLVKK